MDSERLEQAAEALWEAESPVLGLPQLWSDQPEDMKDEYREAVRRAVAAYLGDDDVYVSDMPEDCVTALAPGQSIAWLVDSGYLVPLNREGPDGC